MLSIYLVYLEHRISLNILFAYFYEQSQKHVYNSQIYFADQYFAHDFSESLSYHKDISYSRLIWTEPHLIIFQFILYILY